MIFLYILGAIILLLVILLHSPFKIYVSCRENKFSVYVKYLFFKRNILPKPEKKSVKKSAEKTSQTTEQENVKTEENSDNSQESQSETQTEKKKKSDKKSIFPEDKSERIAFIINILKSSGKALRHFTKRIVIKNVRADIDISDLDACDCAINFGKANIAVYNILGFASCFFKVKKEYININCVYNKPESVYNFSFIVKFTPSAGILSVIAFIFTFFVNNIKAKRQAEKVQTQQ